ncbi:hypothetical protein BMA10247_A2351 [Burkholderia mallei NCTC 10247]|nr:hypothetical protein BMA10247_A2351 [Burkholderia mallei NCTC 10247]EEP84549.1 hypothetical protein BMAGB8_A2359 [Burkholderia mallei GB8 horse 4]
MRRPGDRRRRAGCRRRARHGRRSHRRPRFVFFTMARRL